MASHLARSARTTALRSAGAALAPARRRPATSTVGRAMSVRADAKFSRNDTKPFPSLTVSGAAPLEANGVFAESQVAYLDPHEDDLEELKVALEAANLGGDADTHRRRRRRRRRHCCHRHHHRRRYRRHCSH